MNTSLTRRDFLKQTSFVTASLGALGGPALLRAGVGPNERVRVAVIGCNGRGMDHIKAYTSIPTAEVACSCDVDTRAVEKGVRYAERHQQRRPKGAGDLRKVFEDAAIDAVSIATPDHWHAPATLLACAHGKHVYVEKPASHNAHEGELMVEAARKYDRVVQLGTQRRSWPWVIEAIEALHGGELGKLFYAKSWYAAHRGSIGHGKVVPVPEWLNYDLWQGPAPETPYRSNVIHYNWHWFWNWGTAEMGNNGVHALDLARWGLRVEAPLRTTCGGNRYHYNDDWETPDTAIATFDFDHQGISWEGQSCDPRGDEGSGFGVNFYGENGTLSIAGNSYRIYDLKQKVVRETKGNWDDIRHFANFLDAIRLGKPLNAPIAEGVKSTLLCHLGNIAWRSGHTVNLDPSSCRIVGDEQAAALWHRTYRPGWEPKV